jgi:hypothetical protein
VIKTPAKTANENNSAIDEDAEIMILDVIIDEIECDWVVCCRLEGKPEGTDVGWEAVGWEDGYDEVFSFVG